MQLPHEEIKKLQKKERLSYTYHLANQTLLNNMSTVKLNETEYRRTVPSKEFYTHQWNWDSATVAMGLVHVDPQRAYDELRALIAGQWENGLIAQITYDPSETGYYPQAEKWRTEQFKTGEIVTSGITQPPVLAIAVEHVYRNSPDQEEADKFLNDMLPAMMDFHNYLRDYRDPEDLDHPETRGLLTVVHPWESGLDNSTRWDSSYEHIDIDAIPQRVKDDVYANRTDNAEGNGKVSHRPTNYDYIMYMGLADQFADTGWDSERIVAESPFAVKDIAFSAIWARANDSLANLLEHRGRYNEAQYYRALAEQTKTALANTWSDEHQQYCDIDVALGRHEQIVEPTNTIFLPLFAGAVTEEQLPILLERLKDPEEFGTEYPVPTTSLKSEKFELARYWRGPTWPITNFFIIEGLMRYADVNEDARLMAEHLIDTTLDMIVENGFYEYFDPTKGAARPGREDKETAFGFGNFSWPAAIYIYLYEKYRKEPVYN